MTNALIGHSGFVGSTLLRQTGDLFTHRYRSTDIANIRDQKFDLVVCAGAPAQKWKANKEPEADRAAIEGLMTHLERVTCQTFILISTVDVYPIPAGVDEASPIDTTRQQPYGKHRLLLEQFVSQRFPSHHIVRLPGLVGPGLRKNIIYDFRHRNNMHLIESRGIFQFYPMVNLWSDLQITRRANLPLVNLTAEALSVADIAREAFGLEFTQEQPGTPGCYDLRSRHAALFGGTGAYQYSARESLLAIRAYAQSEPERVTP
jgi:nucleoside-diphosphate-sugar epimerase